MHAGTEYLVQCWNCLGEFDAQAAVWCGCSSLKPTKVCPFCMSCFCAADRVYIEHFWKDAPEGLKEERAGLGEVRRRLGDLLIQEGAVTPDQLAAGLERKAETGQRLGEALVDVGALTRDELERWLGLHKGSFSADLKGTTIRPDLVTRVGVDLCYEKVLLPLEIQDLGDRSILTLAMADTADGASIETVASRTGCRVIPEFAEKEEILEILRNTFPRDEGGSPGRRDMRKRMLEWIAEAVRSEATHIHVKTGRTDLRIYLRIDGVVHEVERAAKKYHPALMREVRRLVHHPEGRPFAQGRTGARIGGRRFELTVRIRRTEHGEDVAVRLVDTADYGRHLTREIPDPSVRQRFAEALSRPGLTVVGSPLYQGRADATYALLWTEHESGRRPRSLERQVRCPLPGVSQEEIPPAAVAEYLTREEGTSPLFLIDLLSPTTAAAVLGAARDRPVVATVKVRGVVPFLSWALDHLDSEELAARLSLMTSQRIARRICLECREPDPEAQPSRYLGLDGEGSDTLRPMRGAGCEACGGRGTRGRLPLFEVLPVGEDERHLLEAGAAAEIIVQEALQNGGRTLRQAFLEAVRDGVIRLGELEKVSF